MRGRLAACAAVALLNIGSASVAMAAAPAERAAVEAVVRQYADGLKQADLAVLKSAFADSGQFITRNKDGSLATASFGTVLPTWVSKADPNVAILIDEVAMPTPNMASVTARLRTSPRCYDDQLLLYRGSDGWRIVAKTTEPWADCTRWPAAR